MSKKDVLFVAGYISKGPNKGKKIAIQVRNTLLLNPVEPIFESYKDIKCLVIGKSEKEVRKALEQLVI